MVQETLGQRDLVMASLSKILSSWSFVVLDAKAISRGLSLGIRDSTIKLKNSWGSDHVIRASIFSIELAMDLTFVNIYGPFQERLGF